MRKLLLLAASLLLPMVLSKPALAMQRVWGFCEQGGVRIQVGGLPAAPQKVQGSYPGCTVNVYLTGSSPPTHASIFSDNLNPPTVKTNPFVADTGTGFWYFYVACGRVDVQLSGGGLASPVTRGDILVWDPVQCGELPNALAVCPTIKGDGATDDTLAIQTCLNSVAAGGGGGLFFPPKVYKIGSGGNVNTTITVPANVYLQGSFRNPTGAVTAGLQNCSTLLPCFSVFTGEGGTSTPAFTMSGGSGIQGFSFFYPDQVTTATPVQFGWAVTSNGSTTTDRVTLKNLFLLNAYLGVYQNYGGAWTLDSIWGEPIQMGLKADRVFDVSNIRDVHFWNFWTTGTGTQLENYIHANGVGIQLARGDHIHLSNIFVLGMQTGLDLEDTGNGGPWIVMSDFLFDLCNTPILVNAANRVLIENGVVTGYGSPFGILIPASASLNVRSQAQFTNIQGFALYAIADIKSPVGNFNFVNLRAGGGSDGSLAVVGTSDIVGPSVINESTALVKVSNESHTGRGGLSDADEVWGNSSTWLDGAPMPDATTDVTPTGFSGAGWTIAGSCGTQTSSTLTFNLNCAYPQTASFTVPAALTQEVGVFVVRFTWQLSGNVPGPGNFQIRIVDTATNGSGGVIYWAWPYLPSSVELGPPGPMTVTVPLVVAPNAPAPTYVQIIWGGDTTGTPTVTISNLKIFRTRYDLASQSRPERFEHSLWFIDPANLGFPLRIGAVRETTQAAVPTSGTHALGDKVWRPAPTNAPCSSLGWVNVVAGTPGTWREIKVGSGC